MGEGENSNEQMQEEAQIEIYKKYFQDLITKNRVPSYSEMQQNFLDISNSDDLGACLSVAKTALERIPNTGIKKAPRDVWYKLEQELAVMESELPKSTKTDDAESEDPAERSIVHNRKEKSIYETELDIKNLTEEYIKADDTSKQEIVAQLKDRDSLAALFGLPDEFTEVDFGNRYEIFLKVMAGYDGSEQYIQMRHVLGEAVLSGFASEGSDNPGPKAEETFSTETEKTKDSQSVKDEPKGSEDEDMTNKREEGLNHLRESMGIESEQGKKLFEIINNRNTEQLEKAERKYKGFGKLKNYYNRNYLGKSAVYAANILIGGTIGADAGFVSQAVATFSRAAIGMLSGRNMAKGLSESGIGIGRLKIAGPITKENGEIIKRDSNGQIDVDLTAQNLPELVKNPDQREIIIKELAKKEVKFEKLGIEINSILVEKKLRDQEERERSAREKPLFKQFYKIKNAWDKLPVLARIGIPVAVMLGVSFIPPVGAAVMTGASVLGAKVGLAGLVGKTAAAGLMRYTGVSMIGGVFSALNKQKELSGDNIREAQVSEAMYMSLFAGKSEDEIKTTMNDIQSQVDILNAKQKNIEAVGAIAGGALSSLIGLHATKGLQGEYKHATSNVASTNETPDPKGNSDTYKQTGVDNQSIKTSIPGAGAVRPGIGVPGESHGPDNLLKMDEHHHAINEVQLQKAEMHVNPTRTESSTNFSDELKGVEKVDAGAGASDRYAVKIYEGLEGKGQITSHSEIDRLSMIKGISHELRESGIFDAKDGHLIDVGKLEEANPLMIAHSAMGEVNDGAIFKDINLDQAGADQIHNQIGHHATLETTYVPLENHEPIGKVDGGQQAAEKAVAGARHGIEPAVHTDVDKHVAGAPSAQKEALPAQQIDKEVASRINQANIDPAGKSFEKATTLSMNQVNKMIDPNSGNKYMDGWFGSFLRRGIEHGHLKEGDLRVMIDQAGHPQMKVNLSHFPSQESTGIASNHLGIGLKGIPENAGIDNVYKDRPWWDLRSNFVKVNTEDALANKAADSTAAKMPTPVEHPKVDIVKQNSTDGVLRFKAEDVDPTTKTDFPNSSAGQPHENIPQTPVATKLNGAPLNTPEIPSVQDTPLNSTTLMHVDTSHNYLVNIQGQDPMSVPGTKISQMVEEAKKYFVEHNGEDVFKGDVSEKYRSIMLYVLDHLKKKE